MWRQLVAMHLPQFWHSGKNMAVCRDVTPCSFVKGAKRRTLKLGFGQDPRMFQCICLNACPFLCLSLTAKRTMSNTFVFRFWKPCKQIKCVVATFPAHRNLPHSTTLTTPTDLYQSHSSSCNTHPSYIPSPSQPPTFHYPNSTNWPV